MFSPKLFSWTHVDSFFGVTSDSLTVAHVSPKSDGSFRRYQSLDAGGTVFQYTSKGFLMTSLKRLPDLAVSCAAPGKRLWKFGTGHLQVTWRRQLTLIVSG